MAKLHVILRRDWQGKPVIVEIGSGRARMRRRALAYHKRFRGVILCAWDRVLFPQYVSVFDFHTSARAMGRCIHSPEWGRKRRAVHRDEYPRSE